MNKVCANTNCINIFYTDIGPDIVCMMLTYNMTYNGDKTDNKIENLHLVDRKEHGRVHAMQRWHRQSVEVI